MQKKNSCKYTPPIVFHAMICAILTPANTSLSPLCAIPKGIGTLYSNIRSNKAQRHISILLAKLRAVHPIGFHGVLWFRLLNLYLLRPVKIILLKVHVARVGISYPSRFICTIVILPLLAHHICRNM